MTIPANTFPVLGAFARCRTQLRQAALRDLTLTDGTLTFRTPDNLAARFAELLNDTPQARRVLAATTPLRTATSALDAAWQSLRPACDLWLATNLGPALGVSGSPTTILAALSREMIADSQTTKANTVSLSQPTAAAANSGDGPGYATLLVPGDADTAHISQLARAQALTLTCIADAAADGLPAGRERFELRSSPSDPNAPSLRAPIEVIAPTTGSTPDQRNLVIDGCFNAYASGAFTHYAATGAANFSQATSGGLFNAKCLRINGTGTATLAQDITARSPRPAGGAIVALGFWTKLTAFSAGSITAYLKLNGTPLDGAITLAPGGATGVWAHHAALFLLPRITSGDVLTLEIVTSGTFSGDLKLDGLSLAQCDPCGDGLSVAVFAGAKPFRRLPAPDRFTFEMQSDDAGALTCFLRDVYAADLPTSETPTVDDTLAV